MNSNISGVPSVTERLRLLPPGQGLIVRQRTGHGQSEAAFMLRDTTDRVAALTMNPPVGIRAGMLDQSLLDNPPTTVSVIVVQLMVGTPSVESLFECWINYHDADSLAALNAMAAQLRMSIQIYGDDLSLLRTLSVPNGLRGFASAAKTRVSTLPPWQPDQFKTAQDAIAEQMTDPMALWQKLGQR